MLRSAAKLSSSSLREAGATNLMRLSETLCLVITGTKLVHVYLYRTPTGSCQAVQTATKHLRQPRSDREVTAKAAANLSRFRQNSRPAHEQPATVSRSR